MLDVECYDLFLLDGEYRGELGLYGLSLCLIKYVCDHKHAVVAHKAICILKQEHDIRQTVEPLDAEENVELLGYCCILYITLFSKHIECSIISYMYEVKGFRVGKFSLSGRDLVRAEVDAHCLLW